MSETAHSTRPCRDAMAIGLLCLATPAAVDAAAPAPCFPSAAEVNRAMARSDDYRGTSVSRMAGCFPLISEEGVQDSRGQSWYCAAEGKPLPSGAPFLEFAIREAPRNGGFAMLVGELGAGCPPGARIRREAVRLVSRRGVTGLFADTRPFLGELGRDPGGPVHVTCAYFGRLGPNHFQITLQFTFDRTGFHRTGNASEEVFDSRGNLIE